MNETAGLPARLPGVGLFFGEDSGFTYGLTVDLTKFRLDRFDADALYRRLYDRLLTEYDRLAPHIAAERSGPGAYVADPENDGPVSVWMLTDDVFCLEIIPAAIERESLEQELPPLLRRFVEIMGQSLNLG
ncbi:hypothetical protein [Paraburkholderia caballeronis]|uniref:hypothetical protein n=1 Tax=Paraburkholderia caballeronis TaxID=416943 RepID=UPI0010670E78|nr:hypothetical protein [Paraburkholderia caballeronis]TDV16286.1 hypothetical protein C7406_108147 [Paraburkholderia caballeronis]TDV20636.1 hypothetical protein C7408_101147 [Paraburkholderia caballeronis]TDV33104.1 hypothetical protein C7404_101243 [Paraburkholderia caballeronis]